MAESSLYQVLIREGHLDSFGHVNNAEVMRLLEEARWEMVTKNGYGLSEVIAEGKGPVVLEANVRYRRELRLRELVAIETRCVGYRNRVGYLEQKILRGAGELCIDAKFTIGLFDLQARRLVLPTEKWKRALSLPVGVVSTS